MSAQQTFAFCLDCWCIEYGISDKNGVYTRDSGSSNHWDHAVHVFGRPDGYPPPIRGVLASLHGGIPISDGRMEMFSLALAITAIQPTNGVKPDAPRAASAPTYVPGLPDLNAAPNKPAPEQVEDDLFNLAAWREGRL